MVNDEGKDFEQGAEDEGGEGSEQAPRARNRTVLLTPDITTQVRARIAQETESRNRPALPQESEGHQGADSGFGSGGFVPVGKRVGGNGFQSPRQLHSAPVHEPPRPAPQPEPVREDGDRVVWTKVTPVVGFLVSFDEDANGQVFVLRAGRLVISSQEPAGGSYLFLRDETVSNMHAIVRISENGELQVLDQLSEYGTTVKRFGSGEEIKLSGEKSVVEHGDTLLFGKRGFTVCVLPRSQENQEG